MYGDAITLAVLLPQNGWSGRLRGPAVGNPTIMIEEAFDCNLYHV